MKKRINKIAMESEISGWLIALAILVIMFGAYMILKGKGTGAIDFLKNLFRFGR